jgi:hypothetical protein
LDAKETVTEADVLASSLLDATQQILRREELTLQQREQSS